ncbi:hypothetical protein RF679_17300 [Undibacterium cyanobacteriorum]|uniref:Transcriptional regulator n=1 Tax=Undibacterium cyanobacteriorum TaxID=3073561 RepID=A0ABY9RJ56_9BURK|nr:PhaM family polyhydroxyalkanoate granule multifunctional regulatory protein [Undibacterium sp. 20NA77.5]WMW80382.1 hypothetical protein RF679_17300 [Undibacterium sp. 20NA77.5]
MQNPFETGKDAGAGLHDPLSFVRKLWGDLQLPGMVTPSLSVDDLDKQIRDLKTVEAWLNLNMNMLRSSIQALEVQRATITALKAMGESFAQSAAGQTKSNPDSKKEASPSTASWPMPGNTISEAQADADNLNEEDGEGEADENEADLAGITAQGKESRSEASKTSDQAGAHTANQAADAGVSSAKAAPQAETGAFPNPTAWWNVLQEQFKHALGQALKDDEAAVESNSKKSAPAKKTSTRAKPSASAATANTSKPKTKGASAAATKSAKKTSSKTTNGSVASNKATKARSTSAKSKPSKPVARASAAAGRAKPVAK